MTNQDIFFISSLITLATMGAYWWGTKQNRGLAQIKIGKKKVELPAIKEILEDIGKEPEIEKELDLKDEHQLRFTEMRRQNELISKMKKQVDRDADDLWEEVRKEYKVGDYNLKVSDDLKKLVFLKPSNIEKTVAALMKRM